MIPRCLWRGDSFASTVLIFIVHNTRINQDTEERKYNQDSQMLIEQGSIGDQVKTKENLIDNTDTIK